MVIFFSFRVFSSIFRFLGYFDHFLGLYSIPAKAWESVDVARSGPYTRSLYKGMETLAARYYPWPMPRA